MHRIASQIRTLEADVAEVYELLAPRDNPTFTGTVSGLNKTMVGLSNVDNTSDANKPISSLTQTALNLKANKDDVYTKTQTDQKITELIDGAPNTLNTLKELATAINNDAAYATNIVSSLAAKADKENPILTGTVKVSDIGGFTTESKARLHVFGGVKNVANEDSAIRVSSWANSIKVELENTATNGKLYELRSNNNGNFEIMDRTGSASRYEISSSGSHTIKGNAIVNGDLAINGIPNVASSLATKQTLVNPVVDIPDWLRLNSAHFEYVPGIFGDTPENSVSRNILTLKTASLPYAPTNNPVFTGNASIEGNLDITGELSVDKIKLHSTTPGSRIEFPDGVLFSNTVSLYDSNLSSNVFSYTTANGFEFNSSPKAQTLPVGTSNTQLATTQFVDRIRGFVRSLHTFGYLNLDDRNACVLATLNIGIPANIFSLGPTIDKVSIFNQSTLPIDLVADPSMELYLAGSSSSTSTLSLPPNGLATVVFISTTKAVVISHEI